MQNSPMSCDPLQVLHGGFECVLEAFLLVSMTAHSSLQFSIEKELGNSFVRHPGDMSSPAEL